MHVVSSQETVAAAGFRDDKSMGLGGGGGGGALGVGIAGEVGMLWLCH